VREFCELAFKEAGLNYRDYVVSDEKFYRPAEVELLVGDSSRIRAELDWEPDYTFEKLVAEMVRHDMELVTRSPELASRVGANG
jgi:GDPmannose 4,6-dehydratase